MRGGAGRPPCGRATLRLASTALRKLTRGTARDAAMLRISSGAKHGGEAGRLGAAAPTDLVRPAERERDGWPLRGIPMRRPDTKIAPHPGRGATALRRTACSGHEE